MRLLQFEADGSLSLVHFMGRDPEPYAILSHTWGSNNEEITYQELLSGTGKEKLGYRKLIFCGQQAAKDGLQYFWVDTCCIDKTNSTELSEAINSMFRWYQEAAKCYVYLSDVSCAADSVALFPKSRWLTRGWTLQELLAPNSVEFFSVEGNIFGDKHTRAKEISEITDIAIEALKGRPLSQFSVEERMAWAKRRTTTRKEDAVYSLLGIFDIQMPLLYGEGEEKARRRLRKEIRESSGDITTNDDGLTRDKRLNEIYRWLSPPDPSSNYQKALRQRQHDTGLWFLRGKPYKSWKTSDLLQDRDDHPGHTVAYFYFDFNDVQKQDPDLMSRSLVYQLLHQALGVYISTDACFSLHKDETINLSSDFLLNMMRQTVEHLPQVYVMIDALDECSHRSDLMKIIEAVAGWELQNMHLIVTSRRERDIESSLEGLVDPQNEICLQSEDVDKDIQQYIRQRLSDDKGLSKWGRDIMMRQEIETAVWKGSKGKFRWAVCQLDTLGKCRNKAMLRTALATLPSTLDKTYERILASISEEDTEYAIRIMRWLAFSERPLSLDELAEVIAIDVARDPAFNPNEVLEDPLEALDICSSLVTILTEDLYDEQIIEDCIKDPSRPGSKIVILSHYSVKEYLVSKRISRSQTPQHSMQVEDCHAMIALACLSYLDQFQDTELMGEKVNIN
ncbi:hypothetical protein CFE70_004673 [Pyrenophora teres f. teres 0-1]